MQRYSPFSELLFKQVPDSTRAHKLPRTNKAKLALPIPLPWGGFDFLISHSPSADRAMTSNILKCSVDPSQDLSVVHIHPDRMDTLCLFRGDIVLVKGTKETIAIAFSDDTIEESAVRLSQGCAENACVTDGRYVTLSPCSDVIYASQVHVCSVNHDSNEPLLEKYLKPFFDESYRPVHVGDQFALEGHAGKISFQIKQVDPSLTYGIVSPNTGIVCNSLR